MTKNPLALVSALRETGVAFAVGIGKACPERGNEPQRLASIAATLIGATVLRLGRQTCPPNKFYEMTGGAKRRSSHPIGRDPRHG
jgi:hypothetical protein